METSIKVRLFVFFSISVTAILNVQGLTPKPVLTEKQTPNQVNSTQETSTNSPKNIHSNISTAQGMEISKPQRRNDRFQTGSIIFIDDGTADASIDANISVLSDLPAAAPSGEQGRHKRRSSQRNAAPGRKTRKIKRKSASIRRNSRESGKKSLTKANIFGVFDRLPLSDLDAEFGLKSASSSRVLNPGPPYLDGQSTFFDETDARTDVSYSPQGFQNSHISNLASEISTILPVENREFKPTSGALQSFEGNKIPQFQQGLVLEGKDYLDYGIATIYSNNNNRFPNYGHTHNVPLEYADQLSPPYKSTGKVLTVTHTQYKQVPVTHYVTDTRTDFITHYKTHLRTKVHEVPVTQYSTRVIPKEVPVYTTVYRTVFHTEYHTTTTNRHHTVHYTNTLYRTTVLTNYLTTTSHLTRTSLLHTTVYEPVYLTTTHYSSIYLTTTESKDYHHTSTSYTPVYVTTTSFQRIYETETVVTPHYITTTLYQEVVSTLTAPLYITTTKQIQNNVPVYLTTTHTSAQYFTTTITKAAYGGLPVHPLARGAVVGAAV